MEAIFGQIQILFAQLAGWFTMMLSSTRTEVIYIAAVFVVVVFRFILMPIFGKGAFGGRSDYSLDRDDDDEEDGDYYD